MKVWKKCIYAFNKETDRLVKMKQWDKNKIQQLKAKLQTFIAITVNVIITALSIIIYFEQSKYHKILDSSIFTDEKNSTWKNWFLDIWKKLAMNIVAQHLFSFSTLFSFINILFIYIIFFSCYKHISFKSSTISEHYINRSFCINLLLYS